MSNAITYYRAADTAAVRNGQDWYPSTRAWCVAIAERYGVAIDTAAAIVAVLSQRKRWRENKLETVRALRGATPRTLGQVQRKVYRLLQGEHPERVVTGDKIRSFYHAIMGDADAVVLDVWMMRVYKVSSGRLTPKQYGILADKLRAEARAVGVTATEYQATIWVAVRGAAQ